MLLVGKREQILVGFLIVLLLATATAGRLAAASDGFGWLASPPVGKVSVDGSIRSEGPPQPTVDQVQSAMQKRIRGFELAAIQSNLEMAGLRQQILGLRAQLNVSTTKLQVTEQDLEFARDQLMQEQVMRENLSRELAWAEMEMQSLTEQVRQAESQIRLLQSQLMQSLPVLPASAQAEMGGTVRP